MLYKDLWNNLCKIWKFLFLKISLCYAQKLSSNECKNLGYSSDQLLCSSCDELKNFKLNELEKSCKQCCIQDREEAENKVYLSNFF